MFGEKLNFRIRQQSVFSFQKLSQKLFKNCWKKHFVRISDRRLPKWIFVAYLELSADSIWVSGSDLKMSIELHVIQLSILLQLRRLRPMIGKLLRFGRAWRNILQSLKTSNRETKIKRLKSSFFGKKHSYRRHLIFTYYSSVGNIYPHYSFHIVWLALRWNY